MIDASKMPVVPNERKIAEAIVYARAPEASGPQNTDGRPPATQRNTR